MLALGFWLLGVGYAHAQKNKRPEAVDMDSPTFVPTVKVGKVLEGGDSIQYMEMNNVYVFPPVEFSSKRQAQAYTRLVKNVKTVLPIAKEANMIMMETAEYLETLPSKKAKEEHMKRVEKSIMQEYKPRMKKLTYSQGKLLIKLIYRESHSSGYELIQAFLGPVRAGSYQACAWAFGASLKKEYDPEGIDRLTERVLLLVEAGQLYSSGMRLGRLSLLASNPNPSPIELLDVIEDVVIQISATITIKQDSIVGHLRLVRIDGIDGIVIAVACRENTRSAEQQNARYQPLLVLILEFLSYSLTALYPTPDYSNLPPPPCCGLQYSSCWFVLSQRPQPVSWWKSHCS